MTSRATFRWTFAITSLAWFAVTLDRLVVTTALPSIDRDLGATAADLEWTVNAYALSFAVLLLTGTALGDRFGRRRMFVIGVALFTAASAAAALAPTMAALIAARAVQGAGGAVFVPLTLTILTGVTPAARRGAVLGLWGGIGGVGAALGPLVGGVLAGAGSGADGWRAIFWLNVPVGLVLIPLARRRLVESRGTARRLDWPGVLLSSGGLLGIVWGVIKAGDRTATGRPAELAIAAGAVLLAGFVAWELRVPEPMLPLRFFADRVFSLAATSSLLMYATLFGVFFLVAQLMQVGLGASPGSAGLRLLPLVAMPALITPVGGALADRIGFRSLMVGGLAAEALAFGWLGAVVTPTVPYVSLVPALVLIGTGNALFFAPLMAATLSVVAPQEHGQASGASATIREVAVVLGVAVLGFVFSRYGSYDSPDHFVAGFVPAAWWAASLAAVGALTAAALPRRSLLRPRGAWDDERHDAGPAGTAGGVAGPRDGGASGSEGARFDRAGVR